MKKFNLSLLLIIFILQLTGCASSPKGEEKQYKKLTGGTVYKAYQQVSITAMKPIIKEYDKQLAEENKPQMATVQVHALLGLIWVASLQPDFALAETDYAMESVSDPRDRYAILALASVAMHQQGWHFMAKQKSLEAETLVQLHNLRNRYSNLLLLTHVAGSALALQEGNISYVASEIQEYGKLSNQSWMVQVGEVTQEVYSGAHTQAITKLEKLQADPSLSAIERDGVSRILNAAKSGGKDAPGEVATAAVYLAVDTAIKSNPLTPTLIEKLPKKYQEKLAKYL